MDNVVKGMFSSGITPELAIELIILVISVIVVLWIRGWIMQMLSYYKFKSNIDISKDVIVRMGTSTGFVDYWLETVDKTSIVLISIDSNLKMILPTAAANERDWIIVKRRSFDEKMVRRLEKTLEVMKSEKPKDDKCSNPDGCNCTEPCVETTGV